MPLVTRTAVSGNHYSQAAAPSSPLAGDLWTDTDADLTYRRDDANANWVLVATHADVSNAEFGYLDGVTSAIQTQINTKAATASPTFTGTVTIPTLDITGGKTHKLATKCFEDFCTGDTLDVIWTQTNKTGTNTFSMLDGINGGMKLATGNGTTNEEGNYNFNNIRHFDPANCTIYGIMKADHITDERILCGITSDTDAIAATSHQAFCGVYAGISGFIILTTCDGTTSSNTATDVAISTNRFAFKIVCGASNVKLYTIVAGAWSLKITKTTNRPVNACQPSFVVGSEFAVQAVKSAVMSYYRIENDS